MSLVSPELGTVYIPDFIYKVMETDELIIEDLKASHLVSDPAFAIKRKLFELCYQIRLTITDCSKELYDTQVWERSGKDQKFVHGWKRKLTVPHHRRGENDPALKGVLDRYRKVIEDLKIEVDELCQQEKNLS